DSLRRDVCGRRLSQYRQAQEGEKKGFQELLPDGDQTDDNGRAVVIAEFHRVVVSG
ncbi:MAG: hypothetical protein RL693_1222, partial [Verrucomicrobiota bacterium]